MSTESTAEFHRNNLRIVRQIMAKNGGAKDERFPKVGELVATLMRNRDYKERTITNYLASVIDAMRKEEYPAAQIKEYLDYRRDIQIRLNNGDMENKVKQSNKQITYGDLVQFRNSLKVGTLDHLVMSLYTCIPPRRVNDYTQCVYDRNVRGGESKTHNFYDLVSHTFYFNVYKTARVYGKYVRRLDEADANEAYLIRAIKAFVAEWRKDPTNGEHLTRLNAIDGVPLYGSDINANQMSKHVTRMCLRQFGVRVGVSDFRHIYITHFYGDGIARISTDEMAKLARDMGHSMISSLKYRRFRDAPAVPASKVHP